MRRAQNRTNRLRKRTGGTLIAGLILTLIAVLAGSATAVSSRGAAGTGVGTSAPPKFKAAKQAVGLTYKGGPTHPGPVYAGTWRNPGLGFCIDFGLPSPNSSGTKKLTGVLPGLDAERSARIKHITNANVGTKSPTRAAHAQLAIWRIQGGADFTTWYRSASLTPADRKAVDLILADATHRAPYKVGLKAAKVHVGQQGSGTVSVLRKGGVPAIGRTVVLSATGAKIVSVKRVSGHQGTTKADGLAFAYQRSKPGRIALKAVVTAPSPTLAGISTTQAGHQRTLSGGYMETAVAHYAYNLTAGKPTIAATCDSDCDGVSTLAFKVCNPAGAQAVSWTQKVGTKPIATLAVAGGQCVTKSAKVADGKVVTASYCYTKVVGGGCTTNRVNTPGTYEVVCPEWTKVTYELGCDCDAADGGTVTFTAPADSIRYYRGFISLTTNGRTLVRPVDLPNGKATKAEVGALPRGGTLVISFGAYRDEDRKVSIGGTHVLRRMTIDPPDRLGPQA